MILRELLCLLVLEPVFLKVQAKSYMQARKSSEIVEEGSSFKFEWDYVPRFGDKGNLREVIFGLWEKGYISSYFITVRSLGEAVENPLLSTKHANYVDRVKWVGDISKSYLAFQLNNIRLSDNNTYGCQLDLGGFAPTIDSKITLIVKKAPVTVKTSMFLHVPQLNNVTVGEVAKFNWRYRLSEQDRNLVKAVQLSCPSYNHHKHRTLWRNDSNGNQFTDQEYTGRLLVSHGTKVKTQYYHHAKHRSFKLRNVTLQDERYYEIKIELGNTRKHLKSRVFLTVNEYPRIESSPQVRNPYNVGDQLTLACIAKGKPAPKINWIKNGQTIPKETERFYHVNEVSVSDVGVYSCRASNQLGSVTSPGVHVHVQYAPTIIFPSETRTVLSWKGNPTRLECIAVGYPAAVYSWNRAGNNQLIKNKDLGNGSVMTITPSADSDFTNYTCFASNTIGHDSAMFLLKPISPPSPPIISNIDVNYNAIKVTWETPPSRQDTPITGHVLQIQKKQDQFKKWQDFKFSAKSNYFILRDLSKGMRYGVRLYANNVAGKSNVSDEKQVKTPLEGRPAITQPRFTDVRISHTSFLVTWDYPDDNGGAEVIMFTVWYRAVRPINNTMVGKWTTMHVTHNSCLLKLNCCSTYELMVTAWNRNGPSFTDPDNAARITVTGENLTCGLRPPHSRNVGGTGTRPGAWPWQVSVKHRFMGHLCGGSVIGTRWILTAAHCFDKFSPTDFTIIAGEHHLRTADGFEQEVAIEKLFKHPRYNVACKYNYDVALLKLNRALKYNNRVGPVCLPNSEFASGSNCFVTGWGTTGNSTETPSQILKEAKRPLVSRDTCRKSLKDLRPFGYCVTKRMRCAGYARGGVDACKGDSGGPLVCHKNRKWYLMGVDSWGAGCGLMGRYGVYADVLRLKRWIQETKQDS